MVRIKDQKQNDLFDPWSFLSPKRRELPDQSWAELFKKELLCELPVGEVAPFFNDEFKDRYRWRSGSEATIDKKTKNIVNVLGGGCPDVPCPAQEMVGKTMAEPPRDPRNITLCGYALQPAYDEMTRRCSL